MDVKLPTTLLALCLMACGPLQKPVSPKPSSKVRLLLQVYTSKLAEAYTTFDQDTLWPDSKDCDGTLWAGLALAGGVKLDLSLAEYSPGEIHRRPHKACWTTKHGDQGSKSTVSQDMLTGYMLGLWRTGDLEALKRLASYGEKRNWVMGEPWPEMSARVLLRPNLIGSLGRALYAVSGGSVRKSYRSLPLVTGPVRKDYERHIQALVLLLNAELRESGALDQVEADLRKDEIVRLKTHRSSDPENPLYHYILGVYSGDFDKTIDLLLSTKTPMPSYARDNKNHWLAEWLFIARSTLNRYVEELK